MRTLNRLLAALMGLGLLAGGLLAAAEIVATQLDRSPLLLAHEGWYRYLRTTQWNANRIGWICAAVAAGGLALVAIEVVRLRPSRLRLTLDADDVTADIERHALERSLARAGRRVDGVAQVRVRISRRTARVRARTHRRHPGGLEERLSEAVHDHLFRCSLRRPVSVRVRLRQRETR